MTEDSWGKLKRITRVLSSIALTFGIMFGTIVAAPVAFAEPAHAYTTSSCYYTYISSGGGSYTWTRVRSCWYDYNWWEESWAGGSHRDGRYYVVVPVYA